MTFIIFGLILLTLGVWLVQKDRRDLKILGWIVLFIVAANVLGVLVGMFSPN
jgi:hypothetical protein